MCRRRKVLAALSLASAVSVGAGGGLLWFYKLVPEILTIFTALAVLLVLFAALEIRAGKEWAIHLGASLATVAMITSSLSRAHFRALLQFGRAPVITVLDVLMVAGFYVFPAAYLIMWGYLTAKIMKEMKNERTNSHHP
ncbi:hypothetical protein HS1genome_0468 [Sulfodiicoccus acidiphilus]|uniref:Uncharacterized protein n=1 Tax=Sulfodiicoccus acidiphilus TaxID=1670455 RepID=A0A348B1M7_9CREN|nr:hypothetical protein [Sulfodiicoccus acidiphilus]BBD72079.1 hypothetical protein HS1genome_0468 [Sulfodiicoccus acidiphilus]GGU05548.1 hypothetical protein GCM10007116_22400 [Sulfodiicoccus acidiphilus]